ncbi:MAG: DUF4400 domain-containing protein [Pseudomonadales bacterium]
MARVLLFLLLWCLQITLVAVFASSAWIQEQIAKEKDSVHAYLGGDTASHIGKRADESFQSLFVDTQVVDGLYGYLIPNAKTPKHGTEVLAPWFFSWLDDSLQTFWWVAYQAIYRLILFSEWMPYLGILLLAAIVDGLVERKIRKKTGDYANSVRYRAGVRALLVLVIIPLLYLTLPISVSPLIVPIWIFSVSIVLMLVAGNAQHRI